MKYQLMYNQAAGEMAINEFKNWPDSTYQQTEGYFTEYGLYDSEKDLDEAIKKLQGKPVFAVFENKAAGRAYWAKEDNLSGNWRGSKHAPYTLIDEFDTQKEAEKRVKYLLESYKK